MADVRPAGRLTPAGRRGQLMLVTGLVLAVVLVALALVLNAAIYTENLSTRNAEAGGDEALEFRAEVVAGVGDLLDAENRRQADDDPGDSPDAEAAVEAFDEWAGRERVERGTYAEVAHVAGGDESGRLLRWNESETPRSFAVDNESDWTLVENVTDGRAFRLELNASTLGEPSDETRSTLRGESFGVELSPDGGADDRELYAYRDGDDVVLRSLNGSDHDSSCRIEHDDGNVSVDLTGERLSNGSSTVSCEEIWPAFAGGGDEYDVAVANGEEAEGTFAFTTDDGAEPTDEDAVEAAAAVYATTVEITYASDALTFETTVRIAPGEPDA